MSAKKSGGSLIAENRKARHYYDLLEFKEAGLVLIGPEVKSLRAHQTSFQDSYVEFRGGEAYLVGLHIAPYANAGYVEQQPVGRASSCCTIRKSVCWPPGWNKRGIPLCRSSSISAGGASRLKSPWPAAASSTITGMN